ncbi:hypothetical protein DDI_2108 [Dickeya dianthicola RNS04.9]|nr:hypothetical protein DDI_2108 [Dickeya dianthicola RNS04.9]
MKAEEIKKQVNISSKRIKCLPKVANHMIPDRGHRHRNLKRRIDGLVNFHWILTWIIKIPYYSHFYYPF